MPDRRFAAKEDHRVQVSLQGAAAADPRPCRGQIDRPVQADGIATDVGNLFQPQPATLGEDDGWYALTFVLCLDFAYDITNVGEGERLIGTVGKRATPGVEDHHRLRAGFDLSVQVPGHCCGVDRKDPVQQIRAPIQHRLDQAEIVRAAAFDHVAGQGEGAAGEADQRHPPGERAADFADGIHDVTERR